MLPVDPALPLLETDQSRASRITIGNDRLKVEISPVGAELTSVRDRLDREWLWQGDAGSWPRQAPVLFPVIGRSRGGVVRHGGMAYPMPSHGIAPNASFEIVAATGEACSLVLKDDAGTRASYPFEFQLKVAFEVSGDTLIQSAEITNTGDVELPYSFGFHPGLRWPLPTTAAIGRELHCIHFRSEEHHRVRRITEDGLGPPTQPSPIVGRTLNLSDSLFAEGAVVFDKFESQAVWFGVPGHDGVLVEMENLPHFGVWTRPPAAFLCLEPWQGYADPIGFDGDLIDKPGSLLLTPGQASSHTIRISFSEHARPWALTKKLQF